MPIEFITLALFRQRRRVRNAVRTVARDRRVTARVYARLLENRAALASTLAVCAVTGFVIGSLHTHGAAGSGRRFGGLRAAALLLLRARQLLVSVGLTGRPLPGRPSGQVWSGSGSMPQSASERNTESRSAGFCR
jgi:hypothetical protein